MQNWGQGPSGEDLEKKVIDMTNRFKEKFQLDPKKNKKPIVLLVAVLVIIVGVYSSMYEVNTEETGVVLRFGKFATFSEPGLHFKVPFGIDRVYLVPTGRVLREEFGFRSVEPGARPALSNRGLEEESLTLTGDLNVTDIKWIVQYQIRDPYKYVFTIQDPIGTIRDLSEAMVRRAVGNANVTQVLTTERVSLAATIERTLQETLELYDVGIRIVTVRFQDVTPPDPVKGAFNEVNEAEQQKESMIFQARAQYNQEVPRARGEAQRALQEAQGYAVERINRASGETNRFIALLTQYQQAPEVTRQRIFIETMEAVLPQLDEIYIMDDINGGALPLLPLRKHMEGAPR